MVNTFIPAPTVTPSTVRTPAGLLDSYAVMACNGFDMALKQYAASGNQVAASISSLSDATSQYVLTNDDPLANLIIDLSGGPNVAARDAFTNFLAKFPNSASQVRALCVQQGWTP